MRQFFSFIIIINNVLFERSRGELAARVFEKQAGMELQREEWREEVVESKRKALEVKPELGFSILHATIAKTILSGGRA